MKKSYEQEASMKLPMVQRVFLVPALMIGVFSFVITVTVFGYFSGLTNGGLNFFYGFAMSTVVSVIAGTIYGLICLSIYQIAMVINESLGTNLDSAQSEPNTLFLETKLSGIPMKFSMVSFIVSAVSLAAGSLWQFHVR